VRLEPVPQPLGGVRWWLRCPGCGSRRAMLYALRHTGRHFRCRACRRLAYASERYDAMERPALRMRTVARRLGLRHPEAVPDLPPKPPGMHWRTYERHATTYALAEARRDEAFVAGLRRLLGRCP